MARFSWDRIAEILECRPYPDVRRMFLGVAESIDNELYGDNRLRHAAWETLVLISGTRQHGGLRFQLDLNTLAGEHCDNRQNDEA